MRRFELSGAKLVYLDRQECRDERPTFHIRWTIMAICRPYAGLQSRGLEFI